MGARDFDHGQDNEGRAFVYEGSAAGLSLMPSWIAESNQAQGELGDSVATAGDANGDGYADVVVGARGYDHGQTEGAAVLYLGSAAGLSRQPGWIGEFDRPDGGFGDSVASAGDVDGDGYDDAVIGGSILPDTRETGVAFVFRGCP